MRKKEYKKILANYEEIISKLAVQNTRLKRNRAKVIMELVDLKRTHIEDREIIDKCMSIVRKNLE